MVTIVDVAQKAGVSVATVSRVLNNQGRVAKAYRKRVLDAVEELEYVPNLTARNLRRNESRAIFIQVPNNTNNYYAHIIEGISQAAYERGYSAFLCNTGDDHERDIELLSRLKRHEADGAIMLSAELGSDWVRPFAEQFPIVQSSEFDPDEDVAHVSIDNYAALRQIMDYLTGIGHRRIAMISCDNLYYSTVLREKAYRDGLTAIGMEAKDDLFIRVPKGYSFQSGFEAAMRFLNYRNPPTAICCVGDMLALGTIACAHQLGMSVPEDVTVTGFDDVDFTTMFHPYLTTIKQPCLEIGRQAMELLYQQIQGNSAPREVVLPHSVIVRESSAPPRK